MNTSSISPVIVVLGAGVDGTTSHLRAEAAAALYKKNPGSRIICSGGRTAGAEGISEAEAMKRYLLHRDHNAIPADRILTESDSLDTASNAGDVARLLRTLFDRAAPMILLVAGTRNAPRAAAYLRAYGYDVEVVAVRDALADSPLRTRIPDSVDPPLTPAEKRLELVLRLLRLIDPRGKLVAAIMQRVRKQRRA